MLLYISKWNLFPLPLLEARGNFTLTSQWESGWNPEGKTLQSEVIWLGFPGRFNSGLSTLRHQQFTNHSLAFLPPSTSSHRVFCLCASDLVSCKSPYLPIDLSNFGDSPFSYDLIFLVNLRRVDFSTLCAF